MPIPYAARNSSVDFLFNCFPNLMGSMPSWVADDLFPHATDTLCPTPALPLGSFTLTWPCLLPLCILGICIGMRGGRSFRLLSTYVSNAFYFFAMMNFSAFLAHSVCKTFSPMWWLTYNWDMAATSASSFNLVLGTLHLSGFKLPSWMPVFSLYGYMPACTVVLHLSQLHSIQVPWVPELLYIGVTSVAACVMARLLLLPVVLSRPAPSCPNSARRRSMLKALLIVVVGVSIFAAGPGLDKYLCRAEKLLGGWGWGNMLVPAFGGCDLAFWGLARYLDLHARLKQGQKIR